MVTGHRKKLSLNSSILVITVLAALLLTAESPRLSDGVRHFWFVVFFFSLMFLHGEISPEAERVEKKYNTILESFWLEEILKIIKSNC